MESSELGLMMLAQMAVQSAVPIGTLIVAIFAFQRLPSLGARMMLIGAIGKFLMMGVRTYITTVALLDFSKDSISYIFIGMGLIETILGLIFLRGLYLVLRDALLRRKPDALDSHLT